MSAVRDLTSSDMKERARTTHATPCTRSYKYFGRGKNRLELDEFVLVRLRTGTVREDVPHVVAHARELLVFRFQLGKLATKPQVVLMLRVAIFGTPGASLAQDSVGDRRQNACVLEGRAKHVIKHDRSEKIRFAMTLSYSKLAL